MGVRGIGVDLVKIPRMREVISRWDERFLRRVFTEEEIAYCRRRRDPIPHFAARFAAKEATLKALGTGLRMGVSWRELEVRRERGQAPTMVLHGRSRALALAKGGDHEPGPALLGLDRAVGHRDRGARRGPGGRLDRVLARDQPGAALQHEGEAEHQASGPAPRHRRRPRSASPAPSRSRRRG